MHQGHMRRHYSILYCSVLYCTVLKYPLLHSSLLHYAPWTFTILHYNSPYCTAIHCITCQYSLLLCPHTLVSFTALIGAVEIARSTKDIPSRCPAIYCTASYLSRYKKKARCAGFLLAPTEGFGRGFFWPAGNSNTLSLAFWYKILLK